MSRADYAPGINPGGTGGLIAAVAGDSPAHRASLVPGDVVTRVDGAVLHDILDWQWATDGAKITVDVVDDTGAHRQVVVTRESDESWGIEFEGLLFDSIRTCRNRCSFCFMTQLPPGLRRSLYVRDDDFRLSFLQGNFISLTNLEDSDIDRIDEQRLSPLYVSLHAVSPLVRAELICAQEDRALEVFDRLLEAGIEIHVQIVLVPDVNDGAELERTLSWLAEREGVASVGIVPLGYTRYQTRFAEGYSAVAPSTRVIEQVRPWQEAFRKRDGVTWVYLADEFYLCAGADLPPAEEYDGFPQFENGIGIARSFVDEFCSVRVAVTECSRRLAAAGRSATLVTGSLAADVLRGSIEPASVSDTVRVLEVRNDFFGGNVSVAGLLVGADLVGAIKADAVTRRSFSYLIPDVVLNSDGLTLDDMTIDDLVAATGADLRMLSCDAAGLLEGLQDLCEPRSYNTKE